jgi:hypothetical protein
MVELNEIVGKKINDLINGYFYKQMNVEGIFDIPFNVKDFLYFTYCVIEINNKYYQGNHYE